MGMACSPDAVVPGHPVAHACRSDADCDDGNPCTGAESCSLGQCVAAEPVVCALEETCVVDGATARCEHLCPIPLGPLLDAVAPDEVLPFPDGTEVALAPDAVVSWSDTVDLAGSEGPTRIVARRADPACDPDDPADWFDHTYDVGPYPSPESPGEPGPIALDHPHIVAWAEAVVAYTPGDDVDAEWQLPGEALGAASGDAFAVLSLGRGGEVVLRVDVADGPGPDLAVFENGFSDGFLELARVEVSSDGTTFVPFPGVSRTEEPVGAYAPLDPSLVHGFAGTWRQGLGTAFDLGLLHQHPLVRAGQVDLQRIRFVKVVDLVGDGSELDAMGRPVYDPFPTVGSAGFDLDAIAVLEAP